VGELTPLRPKTETPKTETAEPPTPPRPEKLPGTWVPRSIEEIIEINSWLQENNLTEKRLAIPEGQENVALDPSLQELGANVKMLSEYYPDVRFKFNKLFSGIEKHRRKPDADQLEGLKDQLKGLNEEVAELQAALAKMSENGKEVRKKLAELKLQNKDVSQWLLQYPVHKDQDGKKEEHGPCQVLQYSELPEKLHKDWNVPLKMAKPLLEAAFEDISRPIAKLYPGGYRIDILGGGKAVVNSLFPDETRPQLTFDEAKAVDNYCKMSYEHLNPALRDEAFQGFEIQLPPDPNAAKLMKQALLRMVESKKQDALKKQKDALDDAKKAWEDEQKECAVKKRLTARSLEQVTQTQLDEMTPMQLAEHVRDRFISARERDQLYADADLAQKILEEVKEAHEYPRKVRERIEEATRKIESLSKELDALEETEAWKAVANVPEEFALILNAFAKAKPFPQPVQNEARTQVCLARGRGQVSCAFQKVQGRWFVGPPGGFPVLDDVVHTSNRKIF
jgi:hypothetical protein